MIAIVGNNLLNFYYSNKFLNTSFLMYMINICHRKLLKSGLVIGSAIACANVFKIRLGKLSWPVALWGLITKVFSQTSWGWTVKALPIADGKVG